jgi:hypothetical protein
MVGRKPSQDPSAMHKNYGRECRQQ